MIKIEDLSFRFSPESDDVLKHIDLTIERGEFVAVLGHNGSGKSTFARMLNGLLTPTSGDAYVLGMNTRDEENLWNIRQTVGLVFQNPDNQIVAAVVEDDVAFGPENLGILPALIRRRVDWALQTVGMYEARLKAPHLLSGGQKQRIAIAGVLAMNPKCIVLDEPTAMLDPVGRAEVMETIRKINYEDQITIVMITHNMDEATLADRIIVMNRGEIVCDGAPDNVFQNTQLIDQCGLEVPETVELLDRLRANGIDIPVCGISRSECVQAIVNAYRGIK